MGVALGVGVAACVYKQTVDIAMGVYVSVGVWAFYKVSMRV